MIGLLLAALACYLVAGLIFGLAFAFAGGAKKVDLAAKDGTWGFKLLIVPGCAIFWPALLKRWLRAEPPPEECSVHRRAARERTSE